MELNTAEEKVAFVWQIFQRCPLLSIHQIPFEQFSNFITLTRHLYNKRENPFHNFVHGATVMHGCYIMSINEQVIKSLDDVQRFALVFSGLIHDVDHTGKTNIYEMNLKTKIAFTYNDRSVLEQHHISHAYSILQSQKANIFCKFDITLRNEIRKFTISNILATDNKSHFIHLNKFEIKLKQLRDDQTKIELEEDRLLLSGILIHASDFFGAVKPFSIAKVWSLKVCQEFTAQVIYMKQQFSQQSTLEELNGLPVTPYLKGLENVVVMAKGEMGFLQVIVKPLWETVNRFVGGTFKKQIDHMEDTLKQWKQIQEEEQNRQQELQQKSIE